MLNCHPRFLEIHCRWGGRSRGRKAHLTRLLVAFEGWSLVRDRTNRKHCPSHKMWSYKRDGRWWGWSFDRGSTVVYFIVYFHHHRHLAWTSNYWVLVTSKCLYPDFPCIMIHDVLTPVMRKIARYSKFIDGLIVVPYMLRCWQLNQYVGVFVVSYSNSRSLL